jgi:hypothetical protein
MSIFLFTTLWWTINQIFSKNGKHSPFKVLFAVNLFIFKLPVVGVALYFAFRYLQINLFALVAGIGVSQIAIVYLGISNLLTKRGART